LAGYLIRYQATTLIRKISTSLSTSILIFISGKIKKCELIKYFQSAQVIRHKLQFPL